MKYYAIERSDVHLAHYGVKGMKWGVRKWNNPVRSKGFYKAKRKLALLSEENRDIRKVQNAQANGRLRKVSKMYKKAQEKLEKLSNEANRDYQRGQNSQMKEDQSRMFWWSDNSRGLAGLGLKQNKVVRLMNRIDGLKSKRLMSDKGHAKAVKRKNMYAKRMSKMFAGTAYDNSTRNAARKRSQG